MLVSRREKQSKLSYITHFHDIHKSELIFFCSLAVLQQSIISKLSLIVSPKPSLTCGILDSRPIGRHALAIVWGECHASLVTWQKKKLQHFYIQFSATSSLSLHYLTSAHICGLMSNHLNFRMERIVALDPARPLIRQGNQNRLDSGDAKSVQVIHTNAGYYGEGGRVGHIDFCVNGGRRWERALVNVSSSLITCSSFCVFWCRPCRQPYCLNTTNVNLCSHIWSVCYMGQLKSLFQPAYCLENENFISFFFLLLDNFSTINIW